MKRALLIALLVAGCGQEGKPEAEGPAPGVDPNLRIGHVMVEVGHRFETAGRAAEAGRWGMAEYQARELLEMFQMDMTRAALPGDCDDAVSDSMYASLLDEHFPALRTAAADRDARAFAEAFRTVSQSCNGCHGGCQVSFVVVPDTPGMRLPETVEGERAGAAEPEPARPEEAAPADPADPLDP